MQLALLSVLQNEPEPESGFSPALSGGLFIVIGVVLILLGVRGLRSGVAKDKFGNEYSGGKAKLMNGFRVGIGTLVVGAGLYRFISG